MEDDSVPTHWRLYGLINGFWISGKTIYATNSWLAEQLKCSERHVSRSLEILEKLGLLTRNIEGFKRLILPGGMTSGVRGGRHPASGGDDVGRQHTSDNILSDNIHSEAELREVKEDDSPKKESRAKYPHSKEVFALWGKYPRVWERNTTILKAAEDIYSEIGMDEARYVVTEWYPKHKDIEFCPQFNDPHEFLLKYAKLEAFSKKI